jgi:hypothetical protein
MKIFWIRLKINWFISLFLFFFHYILKIWKFNILKKASHIYFHTILYALAATYILSDSDPIRQGKINSFSNIEAKVKSCMVSLTSWNHKFTLFVNRFSNFYTIIEYDSWIDQSCFMSNKFRALPEIFWKFSLNKLFKSFIRI